MKDGKVALRINKINDTENINLVIEKELITLKVKPNTPQDPTVGMKLTKKSDKAYDVEFGMEASDGAEIDAKVAITYDMKK